MDSVEKLCESFEGVVFTLHGDENRVSGNEGVQSQ
jgi:hypothetical protein